MAFWESYLAELLPLFSFLRVLFFFLFSLIPLPPLLSCSLLFFITPLLVGQDLHEAEDPPSQSLFQLLVFVLLQSAPN